MTRHINPDVYFHCFKFTFLLYLVPLLFTLLLLPFSTILGTPENSLAGTNKPRNKTRAPHLAVKRISVPSGGNLKVVYFIYFFFIYYTFFKPLYFIYTHSCSTNKKNEINCHRKIDRCLKKSQINL